MEFAARGESPGRHSDISDRSAMYRFMPRKYSLHFLISLMVMLQMAGCAPTLGTKTSKLYRDAHIDVDTTWSGQIEIDGTVKVAKGVTLTISPGTDIAFVRRDADQDGLGDAVLSVEGRLMAVGTRQEPIRFHSAATNPQPGDWLEIRVDFSQEVHLRYCDIRDSAYTLHAHFTRGVVEDCTIHHNIDGCRLGQASFTFRNNLIEHNQGKGINFRNSSVEAHHNIIRHNGSGIFLFESDRDFAVHHNNIYSNLDNFRLGDFYTGDASLHDNWWGAADPDAAQATIYDRSKDPEIGTVAIEPASAWLPNTGPRDAIDLSPGWSYATEGYIDADPVAADDRIYVASWDGKLHVLNERGELLWQRILGDTLDATPAFGGGMVFLQTWSREVYALDAVTGDTRWRFDYSPSRADDHRQGSLLVVNDMVLVPAWNGTLFALDAATGTRIWSFNAGQPLRAQPAFAGDRVYLASGDGSLTVLDLDGQMIWQKSLSSPLLRSPLLTPQGVMVTSRDGLLVCFDFDGQIIWQRELDEPCYYGSAVYDSGVIYLATAGNGLWKLDAQSGEIVWRVTLAGPSYASPLLDGGRLFVGDNSGTLQVFGSDSGDLLQQVQIDREIQGRPLLWAQQLLVGSRDHRVHAFRFTDNPMP